MFFDRYDVASFHDNSLCDHFDTVSSVSTIGFQERRLFSPAGGYHLPEIQAQKYKLQPRSCSKPHSGEHKMISFLLFFLSSFLSLYNYNRSISNISDLNILDKIGSANCEIFLRRKPN